MTTFPELNLSSFDHEVVKAQLIDFLKSSSEFGDFDYEGAAINVLIDLLVREGMMHSFAVNMMANESFIKHAQKRYNVVAKAEGLGYIPQSCVASRLVADITVTGYTDTQNENALTMPAGTQFIHTYDGIMYTFVNRSNYTASYDSAANVYVFKDVTLYQGAFVKSTHRYTGADIRIDNDMIDMSTLEVREYTNDNRDGYVTYTCGDTLGISSLSTTSLNYFSSENEDMTYSIGFGKGVLGKEPSAGAIFELSYVNTESPIGNSISALTAATPINGYAGITVNVTTPAWGGSERLDIETIRWLAPKHFQAQDRAVCGTDYEALVRNEFPFIRYATSWGGEENDPPRYGSVFISVVTKNGGLVNSIIKSKIVSFLKTKNVGSITPVIVDPNVFNIELDVSFSFDERNTAKTFADLSSSVHAVIKEYNNVGLGGFEAYYNQSMLQDKIMSITGIDSVNIDKTVSTKIVPTKGKSLTYSTSFLQAITPGSLALYPIAGTTGTNFRCTDDGIGNITLTYEDDTGSTISNNIGSVDYKTGYVEFNFISGLSSSIKVSVQVKNDNFYVKHNSVAQIGSVNTHEINVDDIIA